MQAKHTELPCSDCNTNPALNDDSRGIKWIQGNVVKAEPCGCTLEGRGFCNYPIHIHYCDTHKAAPDLLAALKAVQLQLLQSNNNSEHAEEANNMANAAIARAEEV